MSEMHSVPLTINPDFLNRMIRQWADDEHKMPSALELIDTMDNLDELNKLRLLLGELEFVPHPTDPTRFRLRQVEGCPVTTAAEIVKRVWLAGYLSALPEQNQLLALVGMDNGSPAGDYLARQLPSLYRHIIRKGWSIVGDVATWYAENRGKRRYLNRLHLDKLSSSFRGEEERILAAHLPARFQPTPDPHLGAIANLNIEDPRDLDPADLVSPEELDEEWVEVPQPYLDMNQEHRRHRQLFAGVDDECDLPAGPFAPEAPAPSPHPLLCSERGIEPNEDDDLFMKRAKEHTAQQLADDGCFWDQRPAIEARNGLLSPEGKFHPCLYWQHDRLAARLVPQGNADSAQDAARRQGWISLGRGDWSLHSNDFPIKPTQRQIDFIFDWCQHHGVATPEFEEN